MGTAGCSQSGPAGGSFFPGSRVVWIGDSYLTSGNGGIRRGVEARARAEGSLAATDAYRFHYQGGTQITSGEIPGQYGIAHAEDPEIDVVVMDGGGNDILIGNPGCLTNPPPGNTSCVDTFDSVVSMLQTLWTSMAADGVTHVVFFYYPHIPYAGANANIDYSAPLIQTACESFTQPLACYFVDPRATFEGQSWIDADDVHPNADGQDALAEIIWYDTMVANGIAQ